MSFCVSGVLKSCWWLGGRELAVLAVGQLGWRMAAARRSVVQPRCSLESAFLTAFSISPKRRATNCFFFTPIFFIASCTAVFPAALFLQNSQALALLAAHWACKSSVGFIERTGPTAVLFRGHLTVKMYVIHNCVAKKEIPCASIHVFSPLSHKSRTAINAVCLYTWVWAWIAHYLISKAVLFCIWEHV